VVVVGLVVVVVAVVLVSGRLVDVGVAIDTEMASWLFNP